MRHTLLPLDERIKLRREYYRRVTIVFCFTLALSVLIGIASLFPTFVRSTAFRIETENALKLVQGEPEDKNLKDIQKSVAQSLALLQSLKKDSGSENISDLISEIIKIKGNIKFTNFSASKVSTTTLSMNIQGVAPTRNDLLLFRDNFEKMIPGNKVDLPVSELAKNTNFQFTVSLKQKLQ